MSRLLPVLIALLSALPAHARWLDSKKAALDAATRDSKRGVLLLFTGTEW